METLNTEINYLLKEFNSTVEDSSFELYKCHVSKKKLEKLIQY